MRSQPTPRRRPGRPAFSAAEALTVLHEFWSHAGQLKELPSDSDQNFRVDVDGRPRFVLRFANASQTEPFLEAVTTLLSRLEGLDLGTQHVVPALDGSRVITVEHPNGLRHLVWVTEWIAGRTLADHSPRNAHTLRGLGDFVARLDAAIEDFDDPALHRHFDWDLARGAEVIEAFLRGDADSLLAPDDVSILQRALHDHLERYEPLLQLLPRAAVHNDPNDHNVLISDDPDSPDVVGILDFGDAAHSFRVADLAIAAAYAMLGSPTPIHVVREIVAGYSHHRPLSDLELHLLLPLIRVRLMVSVLMSARASALEPHNNYLTVSREGAWTALRQLSVVDFDRVAGELSAGASRPRTTRTRHEPPKPAHLRAERTHLLAPSLTLSYDEPLAIVRGWMQHLFDERGRAYLDCVNNICHVGHSHPRVVAAIADQAALLNTNSRYLHPTRIEYAKRLTALLPEELDTCFFVSSGTEANELALRIARAATGREQVVVLEGGYHGNSAGTVDVSPYKFDGPGGHGRPEHVQVAPLPDVFRGACRDAEDAKEFYVGGVRAALGRAAEQGGAAALLMESIPSCAGQIVPPPGFVRESFEAAREAGAVTIADEVQTGFGRVGSAFWAFELDDAHPDIVTLGKPIGNGHPMGAVVVRRELAEAFADGMEYFASFGGNPVSCAVGLAVLDVIRDEGLQQRAAEVGDYLVAELRKLALADPRVGDVRGRGLFVGAEFVVPGPERRPDAALAHSVVQQARGDGVLLSADGLDQNVIKIKPPLTFTTADVDRLTACLRTALRS